MYIIMMHTSLDLIIHDNPLYKKYVTQGQFLSKV